MKPCPSYPGYSASDDGRVFSHKVKRKLVNEPGFAWDVVAAPQRELVQKPGKRGSYRRVVICIDGRPRFVAVHAMVADAFKGPRPSPLHEVRHLDGVDTNNHATNVEWGTKKQNADDRRKHGHYPVGEAHPRSLLTTADVRAIRERFAADPSYGSKARLAREFGIGSAAVSRVIAGRTWRHVLEGSRS